jgi:hypothetical protein
VFRGFRIAGFLLQSCYSEDLIVAQVTLSDGRQLCLCAKPYTPLSKK